MDNYQAVRISDMAGSVAFAEAELKKFSWSDVIDAEYSDSVGRYSAGMKLDLTPGHNPQEGLVSGTIYLNFGALQTSDQNGINIDERVSPGFPNVAIGLGSGTSPFQHSRWVLGDSPPPGTFWSFSDIQVVKGQAYAGAVDVILQIEDLAFGAGSGLWLWTGFNAFQLATIKVYAVVCLSLTKPFLSSGWSHYENEAVQTVHFSSDGQEIRPPEIEGTPPTQASESVEDEPWEKL